MRYVKLKGDVQWPDRVVKKGTVVGVDDDRRFVGLLFILTGELKNRTIHSDHIEDVDMLELLDQARADEQLAVRNADRLTDNVFQLQSQLLEMREPKRVTLPRDVGETLAQWQKWYTPEALAYDLFHPSDKTRGLDIVRTYAVIHFDNFLDALRYGYTIEETKEDTARQEIRRFYQQFCQKAPHGADGELAWAREGFEEAVHYLGGDAILADISPWNQMQLKKKQPANG